MNLWFVPAALVAAGFIPVAVLVGRLRREVVALGAQVQRTGELRSLISQAADDARATQDRVRQLSEWRWPRKSVRDLAP